MVDVEGNAGRQAVGNASPADGESCVACGAVGAIGTEIDRETETVDGGEADNSIHSDVGTESKGEDDGSVVVAALCVRGKVADNGGQASVRAEGIAVGDSTE